MATIEYTPTEKALMSHVSHLNEVDTYELESLAKTMDEGSTRWIAVELGRCPSTDVRTYILHTYYNKPTHDYYGVEEISLEILKLN